MAERAGLQFAASARGITAYLPIRSSALMSLHGQFNFHHSDLCLFQHAIQREIDQRNEAAAEATSELRARYQSTRSDPIEDDEAEEWRAVVFSRMRESLNVHDMETASIQAFGDHLVVVGLWSMVEQYCGRTLLILEKGAENSSTHRDSPHQWDALAKRFAAAGIVLAGCKSYEGVDECRILNNKIKHSGFVDAQLSRFARFRNDLGKDLRRLQLDLQYYADSVYEFTGCVMEAADDLLPDEFARGA